MYSITLLEFKNDYNLRNAGEAYEMLTAEFVKHYKRQPVCGIFIGTAGDKMNQFSTVTARWTTESEGRADGEKLLDIATRF